MAYLGKVFNVILVKRNDKDTGPIKQSLKTLKSNQCIALFPEGTRNGLKKGEKVKGGASFFALNSNAAIIPVGIKGGEKPFKKATITYGKPLNLEEYKQTSQSNEETEKLVDEELAQVNLSLGDTGVQGQGIEVTLRESESEEIARRKELRVKYHNTKNNPKNNAKRSKLAKENKELKIKDENDKVAFLLKQNLPVAKIAEELKYSVSKVKRIIKRIKDK